MASTVSDPYASYATDRYTSEELEWALDFRQSVTPAGNIKRRDRCPHAEMCEDIGQCVRYIAWYRRWQRQIESEVVHERQSA